MASEQKVTLLRTDYLGGLASQPKTYSQCTLYASASGFSLKRFKTIFEIPLDQVQAIEVEGPDQAAKRFTATRILAFGVGGLIRKKDKSAVLTLAMRSGELAIFQTHSMLALDLKARLAPILSLLNQRQPVP